MGKKDASVLDADRMREYSIFLKVKKEEMMECVGTLLRRMEQVKSDWDDKKNEEYVEQFSSYLETLKKVCNTLDDYSRFVKSLYDILVTYKNQHSNI